MPVHVLYSFRYALRAFVFVALVVTFSCFSPAAYADPHAVFYTDRAQEQVFYNTLAALNQADFVEPSLPDGTQRTRQELANRRAGAIPQTSPNVPFVQEDNPLITSTHTDLPAVLSRNITLEGNDLWTAYLVHQFALETRTRKSESRLARILCQYAVGDPGCNTGSGNNELESTAFTTNPTLAGNEVALAQQSILGSGTQAEEQLRKQILNETDKQRVNNNRLLYTVPRPNSPALELLVDTVKAEGNTGAEKYLNNLTNAALSATNGINPDPNTFSDLTFESDGSVSVPESTTATEYTYKLSQLLNLPGQLVSLLDSGTQQAEEFLYYQQHPTAVADSILQEDEGTGGLTARITTPVSAKLAAIDSSFELANLAASQQHYANADAITTPGKTSLVDPASNAQIQPGQFDTPQQFNGTAQNPTPPNGQVAGLSTGFDVEQNKLFQQAYEQPSTGKLSPATNSRDPLEEPGVLQLLDRLTNRSSNAFGFSSYASYQGQGAFDIQMASLLKSNTETILCSIYPSLPLCADKNV